MTIRRYFNRRRMKKDSKNREEVLRLLVMFFGNERKAEIWIAAPNPLLGDVTPEHMISTGRSSKLIDFIKECMDEDRHGGVE